MGNKIISENQYGKIVVWTEKKTYTAGDQFNGVVYLTLEKPFPTRCLNLILSGMEKVKMTKSILQQEQDGATSEVIVFEDENEFYNYNFPLFTNPSENFPAGQYQFPFSFILEETLPGSFQDEWYEDGENCYAQIEYSIASGLMNENRDQKLFDKLTFNVDQKFVTDMGYSQRIYESSLTGYCCKDLGKFMFSSQFGGTSYLVGENAKIQLQLDASQLKTNVNKIQVQLNQYTTYKAQDQIKTQKKNISTTQTIGIIQGDKKIDEQALPIEFQINCNENQASTNGTLITNQFKLEVVPEIDSCLCYSDQPINQIDIKIFNQQQTYQVPNMGEGFQPVQEEPQVLTFGEDYRMTKDFANQLLIDAKVEYPTIQIIQKYQ